MMTGWWKEDRTNFLSSPGAHDLSSDIEEGSHLSSVDSLCDVAEHFCPQLDSTAIFSPDSRDLTPAASLLPPPFTFVHSSVSDS